MPEDNLVKCSCGVVVGTLRSYAGQDLLEFNGIVVRSLYGVCTNCGQVFHWSVGDRMLAKLLQRYREREHLTSP